MSESLELLSKPFLSINGKGSISFNDGLTTNEEFVIMMSHNGKIIGDIHFSTDHLELLGYVQQMRRFKLNGIDIQHKGILADDCFLTSLDGKHCKFSSHTLMWNPDILMKKTSKELSVRLSLVNVYDTSIIQVETTLGTLDLRQYQGHKELEKLMSNYRVPLITSILSLHIHADGSKTIEEISNEAVKLMEDFLKITSLSQTTWHDWTMLEIYEQIDGSDQGLLIYRKLRSPKLKPPHYRQLTNPAHASYFIRDAWKGYSHDNNKYGFDLALEWYIESNSASLDVTKFVNATTCLELLISKFNSLNLVKTTSEELKTKLFYRSVRKNISKFLKSKTIGNDTISQICQLIVKRQQTYVKTTKNLLDYWGISISDIKTSVEEIVKIRNSIIHSGLYFHDEDIEKAKEVIEASENLFQILTRILLAILKYDGDYYDPRRSKWIKFSDVCSKIGCQGFN